MLIAMEKDQVKGRLEEENSMEDSTMMTIEFLRARLLSERSVSRTTKQRADELAKKVMELEEQLKNVTFQRKKAEKTTAEVLEILENNGISDCTETSDSSSDQESRPDNNTNREEDSSPLPGRRLPWKSCSDHPSSAEKEYINQARRRRCGYLSTNGSSPKPRLGKSCRQIKRRDVITAADEVVGESIALDAQENGVASREEETSCEFKNVHENSKEGLENKEEKVFLEGLVPDSLEDKRKETCPGLYEPGNKCDLDVKNAMENQAWLLGRYEAEEIAQREWEEKFREDGSCTPDSYERGNQSDVIEERDEISGAAERSAIIPYHGEEAKSEAENPLLGGDATRKYVSSGLVPGTHLDIRFSQNQQCNIMTVNNSRTSSPKFSCKMENLGSSVKGNRKEECSGVSPYGCEHHLQQKLSSFHAGGGLHKRGTSRSIEMHQEPRQQETQNQLGDLLNDLQQAKLSLKHELGRLPSSTQVWPMVIPATTSHHLATNAGNVMEIPLGCAGLFRVPTNSQLEANISFPSLDVSSDSKSSLTKSYPNVGFSMRYPADPNLDIGLRNYSPKTSIYLDMGMAPPNPTKRIEMPNHAEKRCSDYRHSMRSNIHNIP